MRQRLEYSLLRKGPYFCPGASCSEIWVTGRMAFWLVVWDEASGHRRRVPLCKMGEVWNCEDLACRWTLESSGEASKGLKGNLKAKDLIVPASVDQAQVQR